MKSIFFWFFAIFLSAAFFSAPVFASAEEGANFNAEKIFYMSTASESRAIADIKANAGKMDILAPQAYAVGYDLNLYGSLSQKLQDAIKNNNLKVMPLVVNSKFSQTLVHNFLLSSSAQDKVIDGLVYLAKKNNYIGWQFDFENINYLDKDLYSAFVEKAAEVLHKNNLILSVAAVSRTADYEDTLAYKNWGGVFDYERIAKAVDFISMMTYDDSKSYGPTASVLYVKAVLEYVKDKIPAEKLSMGIPFYYWGWTTEPVKRISSGPYSLVSLTMQNFNYQQGFDSTLGVSWLTYSSGSKAYKIWYEDKRSFEVKLDIAKDYNLRGFSAWVLGSEDPAIWAAL